MFEIIINCIKVKSFLLFLLFTIFCSVVVCNGIVKNDFVRCFLPLGICSLLSNYFTYHDYYMTGYVTVLFFGHSYNAWRLKKRWAKIQIFI
jgi:hypothetical protein